MATYADWVEDVKTAYQGGIPSDAQILMTLKDGVSAIMARDTESDLQLARSYQDRFDAAKIRFAGTRLDTVLVDVITSVRELIPIAADTDAQSAALDNAIEAICDDFNQMADKFDAYLLQAATELQRHVPFYRARQLMTLLADTDGITSEGFVSKFALPEDQRIKQIWYGKHYPALAEGDAIEEGDIVISNGRLYQCTGGGTLATYELGAGLTSTDGEEEDIGSLTFKFYRGDRDFPARPVDWLARQAMRAGQLSGGPLYALTSEQDLLWLYPALDDTHRFDVEFVAVAQSFQDTDTVTFDRVAAKAASHYIRGMFQTAEQNDARSAAVSLALFQRTIREAIVDCQDRETGPDLMTAPYDWARNPRICGTAVTADTTTEYPNGYLARINSSGDISLESSASNMVIDLTVLGDARDSNVILGTTGRRAGDVMVVLMALPATVGIAFSFLNGTAYGASLLPEEVFPDQKFTTDGDTLSAMFEFVFNGTAWEYQSWKSPA